MKISDDNMIIKTSDLEVEKATASKKTLSMSLRMISTRIKVECTMKHTLQAQLDAEKVRILPDKLLSASSIQLRALNISFSSKGRVHANHVKAIGLSLVQCQLVVWLVEDLVLPYIGKVQ